MKIIETVDLAHAGAELKGYLALPEAPGPHRAILVMHNAHGLGEHMKRIARRLAEAGYVALATDMLGGGVCYETAEETGKVVGPLFTDAHLLRGRVTAWYELLKAMPGVDPARMGAIGYCFGGQCVLDLARSGADLKVVVSYHGLLQTALPAPPGGIRPQVAVYTGARDPYVPRRIVDGFQDEMRAAGANWQITVFGEACHAFTDPEAARMGMEGLAYDPLADRISWAGTEVLLEALV